MKTVAEKDALYTGIAFLYQEFTRQQDETGAEMLLDLVEKIIREEWIVSFSGHFSAGKSTMINRLLDQQLLPQSPIPTSANIVKLLSGEPGITVYKNNLTIQKFPNHTDIETIQKLCRDGEFIRKIDIIKESGVIPPGVAIMDTPGIDSVNDADRVITESSLHLVDLLIYVMDYNHVQSEVNLKFLKEMQQQNKPFFVVINQMDKHTEAEIEFDTFKASVFSVFNSWSIYPEHIFFTSLSNKEFAHNQWEAFRRKIDEQIEQKEEQVLDTVRKSAKTILKSHFLNQKEKLQETTADSACRNIEELQAELLQLKKEKNALTNKLKDLEKEYRNLIDSTLKNAILMPYEVREKAESFLEAYQSDFKPGIFTTKKKVATIRAEKKKAFYSSLEEKITANLEWKLKEKVVEFIKSNDCMENHYLEEIQNVKVDYSVERLTAVMKPGARITAEYLLRYTEDVSNDIKQAFKQAYINIWENIKQPLNKKKLESEKKWEVESKDIEKEISQAAENQKAYQQLIDYENALLQAFHSPEPNPQLVKLVEEKVKQRMEMVTEDMQSETSTDKEEDHKKDNEMKPVPIKESDFTFEDHHEKLIKSEKIFKELRGLESFSAVIHDKRRRLENRNFTVALFGAFSAGKSSFANALLGENVLPVSPNPTTAVINKISPPDSFHTHRTVVTKVKSEASILEDIEQLEQEIPGASLEEKITSIQKLLEEEASLSIRDQAFLQAVLDGYPDLSSKLGQQVTIDHTQFAEYVATESIACYLEWTELFFDCSLTRQGISLIDTPGADSINSRHTELAFNYIKNADAILFVTYYNHAFSKADKDFLLQLGRVKDAFSMDKMFFIINASDLADSDAELKLVENYVADELVKFGIRQPRMFPLSSKEGLKEKQDNRIGKSSGLSQFEEAFYHFLRHELTEILSRSAIHDIKRGLKQLESYISSASMETKEKKKKIEKLAAERDTVLEKITRDQGAGIEEEIIQKLTKQFFYIQERDAIQFSDRFKEFFNPTTVTTSGSALKKEMTENILALVKETAYQLSQEIRAVSIRMESFLNQKAEEYVSILEKTAQQIEPSISFPYWDEKNIASLSIEAGMTDLTIADFNGSLSVVKNKSIILDRNERDKLKESIYNELSVSIERYLREWQDVFAESYKQEWKEMQEEVKDRNCRVIEEYYQGILYSLSDQINVSELKEKLEEIKQIVN